MEQEGGSKEENQIRVPFSKVVGRVQMSSLTWLF